MNKVYRVLCLLALAGFLNACSDIFSGEADPLRDESADVQNGKAPGKEKEPPKKPVAQDVLLIDASDSYTFREGIEQEITINGRSMFDESIYEMEISNVQDFKDAVVTSTPGDKKAGVMASIKFKWKPPVGFVILDKMYVDLDVTISTKDLAENYIHKKTIKLFVYNESYAVPKILSVTGVPQNIKESGGAKSFKVLVEDYESKDVNGERPSLLFLSKSVGLSLVSFVKVDKLTYMGPTKGQWLFDVSVNLNGLEMTPFKSPGYFDIYAVSANSVQSNPSNVSLEVWTSIGSPISSWVDPIEFKIGVENNYTFTVLDPKAEGNMTVNFKTQCGFLDGSPVCSCKAAPVTFGKPKSVYHCSIQWTVPETAVAGTQSLSYEAQNSSPITGDFDFKTQTFNGTIQLVK